MPKKVRLDFLVHNGGSIWLFHPCSDGARSWLDEHCPQDDSHRYHGHALVVEHRYVSDLIRYAQQDGLVVGT
jgi:hypothetical protein